MLEINYLKELIKSMYEKTKWLPACAAICGRNKTIITNNMIDIKPMVSLELAITIFNLKTIYHGLMSENFNIFVFDI